MYGEISRPLPTRLLPDRGRKSLTTERLVLRPPSESDSEALIRLAGHAAVAAMATDLPHPFRREDAAALVRRGSDGGQAGRVYAVTQAADDAVLGCCTVQPAAAVLAAELNFWLGKPYWNLGYMTEAAQAVIDHIFADGEVERIDARCRAMNAAARRVLHKCGFRFQTSSLSASLSARGNIAVDWYSLDRRLWESLRRWGSLRRA